MEKLWTTSEVAKFLGIAEGDVEQLVREDKLTAYKLGGRFLRFRPDQVQALKQTEQVRPAVASSAEIQPSPFYAQALDFFYFYDFYLISAGLLALLVIYLIISG